MSESAVLDEIFGDITEPVLADEVPEDVMLELRQSYRLLWVLAFAHWVYFGTIRVAKTGLGFNTTYENSINLMMLLWSLTVWAVFMFLV